MDGMPIARYSKLKKEAQATLTLVHSLLFPHNLGWLQCIVPLRSTGCKQR